MDRSTSSTSQLIHLAWPVLIAQLAMMANAVIDTAMAGRLSAIDLASVGIAASIMSTVLMTLISVLLALPPIIAHLYGGRFIRACGYRWCWRWWRSCCCAFPAL